MKTNRNWPAILAEAQARGVWAAALAREQSVTRAVVSEQSRKHGVALPPAPVRSGRDWRAELAEASARGIGVVGLARHLGVSSACVCQQAQAYGVRLKGQRYL